MKKMNRENRTSEMIVWYRVKWIIFYALVISGIIIFCTIMYDRYKEDRLPSGNIELTVSKEKYQPKETVNFTIKNHFPTPIYIPNNCPEEPLSIFKWDGGNWKPVSSTAKDGNADCYRQPRRIKIGAEESISYNFSDWPDLFKNAGVYRIVVPVEHYDDLPFKDFVILEPQKIKQVTSPSTTPSNSTLAQPSTTNTAPTTRPTEDQRDDEKEVEIEDEYENEIEVD